MADPTAITSADRREIRERLQQQKNSAFSEVWVDRLKSGADIRDFRTQQRMMQPQAPPM